MTRVLSIPHLQTNAPKPSAWLVTINQQTEPVPELLKGWDYSTPLTFESSVHIDRELVGQECDLGTGWEVTILALHRASSTGRRTLGVAVPVTRSGDISITFSVDPSLIGGKLSLVRQLVLSRKGSSAGAFAPSNRGAILWTEASADRTSTILEGDAARFPTEYADLGKPPINEPRALWWLDIDMSDLDRSPLAAMRLYLNSGHPVMHALAEGSDDDGTRMAASALEWDVARSLIHHALDANDFIDGWGSFPPETLGASLEQLVRSMWPTQDARTLQAMRASEPERFESRLQGRLGLFGGIRR